MMEETPHAKAVAWHFPLLVQPTIRPAARLAPPYYAGLYNLVRLSRQMVLVLGAWYEANGNRWVFFEPLIGTLAMGQSLKTSHLQDIPGFNIKFRYRPCWTGAEVEAARQQGNNSLFHPVKELDENCI
jgi:hypothetical protein